MQRSITEALGLQGWAHLDPVLLAALAEELPLLLVGSHGVAKSQLVEQIAGTLGLAFRHYNASLVNYDDLVGIPLPEPGSDHLRFVSTPGAVWGAEFVFLDEISRCRPDLQNKLFPLIHERRVAGIPLDGLKHRWAAMNPPYPDGEDALDVGAFYLGSERLDPALTDRFPFIVTAPTWRELTQEQRLSLIRSVPGEASGRNPELERQIRSCAELAVRLEGALGERLATYIVQLMQELEGAGLPQSPRRARMLFRSALAVHAAGLVLGREAELESSVSLAVRCGVPQSAGEAPPCPAMLLAVHRQAWEISGLAEECAWRRVLEEPDPVRRISLGEALGLGDADLSRLITQALGAEPSAARRLGLGVSIFLRFRDQRNLPPAAWELLAELAARVLEPRRCAVNLTNSGGTPHWQAISQWMASWEDPDTPQARLERSYLLCGFPEIWNRCDWRTSLEQFRIDLQLLEVPLPGLSAWAGHVG